MRAACGAGRHVRPDLSGADTVKERPPVKMNPASLSALTVMADDAASPLPGARAPASCSPGYISCPSCAARARRLR